MDYSVLLAGPLKDPWRRVSKILLFVTAVESDVDLLVYCQFASLT